MDLRTLVDVSQLVAATTVVGGTVFALLQLREIRRQRQEAVALDVLRTLMNSDFAEAMMRVTNLPDGMGLRQMREAGPDVEKAATLMATTFEAIGVMVHRRIAPLPLVQDLIGGIVVVLWRRLGPWIRELRVEQSNPSDSEWFQWLAEQVERRGGKQAVAYEAYRDWKP
jgi:hypothetical protein